MKRTKAAVAAVAVDLSPAYTLAVRPHLPGTVIVHDHFHLVNLLNEKLSDLRREVQQKAMREEKQVLKGTRWLLLKRPENLCRVEVLDRWLRRAYVLAELEPRKGGMWHPFRRKWATERKGLPPVDVAAAGGWKNPNTPLRIYQQADKETMRAVVSAPAHRLARGS